MKTINLNATTITLNDFHSICRICICDCKSAISFNINESVVLKKNVSNVLSKYVSEQASRLVIVTYMLFLFQPRKLAKFFLFSS